MTKTKGATQLIIYIKDKHDIIVISMCRIYQNQLKHRLRSKCFIVFSHKQ